MNIIFVCHGSICRSPAAEYIMKSLSTPHCVISRAISYEEIGNDIYPPMKKVLLYNGIKVDRHYATYLSQEDIAWADYIFYMDASNYRRLVNAYGENEKFLPITKYSSITEIEDPWYTGNYQLVFNQIKICVENILSRI